MNGSHRSPLLPRRGRPFRHCRGSRTSMRWSGAAVNQGQQGSLPWHPRWPWRRYLPSLGLPPTFPLHSSLSQMDGVLLAKYEPCALLVPKPRGLVVRIPARQFPDPFTRPDGHSDDAVEMNVADFDADVLCNQFWHVAFLLPRQHPFSRRLLASQRQLHGGVRESFYRLASAGRIAREANRVPARRFVRMLRTGTLSFFV